MHDLQRIRAGHGLAALPGVASHLSRKSLDPANQIDMFGAVL